MQQRRAEGEIAPKQMKKGKKVKDGNVAVQNIVQGKRVEVKFQFKVGDGVSVKAEEFDGKKPGSFSKDNPGRQLGVVVNIWPEKEKVEIEYLDGCKFVHDFKRVRLEKPKMTALLILQVMVAESLRKAEDPMDKETWPKNFFEAIIRPDWRN